MEMMSKLPRWGSERGEGGGFQYMRADSALNRLCRCAGPECSTRAPIGQDLAQKRGDKNMYGYVHVAEGMTAAKASTESTL